jgi:hypothetical protein
MPRRFGPPRSLSRMSELAPGKRDSMIPADGLAVASIWSKSTFG